MRSAAMCSIVGVCPWHFTGSHRRLSYAGMGVGYFISASRTISPSLYLGRYRRGGEFHSVLKSWIHMFSPSPWTVGDGRGWLMGAVSFFQQCYLGYVIWCLGLTSFI